MDLLRRRSPYSYTGSQCPTVADSVIGLINLLYEVKMPHIKMQPMAYSTPADSPNRNRSSNANKIFKNNYFFAFFAFTIHGEKRKKKYHSLAKELFPPKAVFIVPSPFQLPNNVYMVSA
jgi:hypothetical protein